MSMPEIRVQSGRGHKKSLYSDNMSLTLDCEEKCGKYVEAIEMDSKSVLGVSGHSYTDSSVHTVASGYLSRAYNSSFLVLEDLNKIKAQSKCKVNCNQDIFASLKHSNLKRGL